MEEQVWRTNKNGEGIAKNISYILKFIDSIKFIASSLSNIVNNLSERIHRIKCIYGHDDKKWETCVIKYKYCDCIFEYTNFKDDLIEQKCLCCNKNYQHKFDERLKERFLNKYKFSHHNDKKFILLFWKMFILVNIWMIGKNSMKYHYLKKKDFYSHLNIWKYLEIFEICVSKYMSLTLKNSFSSMVSMAGRFKKE